LVEISRQLQTPRVTPFAGDRLTRTQLEALFLITHRPRLTPRSLADALNVTAGAVTQIVAGLRANGLVETIAHPHDARSVLLTLTPKAKTEIETFEDAYLRRVLPRFARLSTHHLRHLSQLLDAILMEENP
jgi:DNA-binding MarR family transcriptional regulator